MGEVSLGLESRLEKQSILIIIGMHRSGTSLTASLLQDAGVDIGNHLMGASEGNQKGHFEDLDFVQFHEEVLRSQGMSQEGWTLTQKIDVPVQFLEEAQQLISDRSSKAIWGWKDPRTTLFLDFWSSLLPDAKFLLVYRSPWEVVDSLFRRSHPCDDVFFRNPIFALDIWQHYNSLILEFYQKYPEKSILIDINSVIDNFDLVCGKIKSKLEIELATYNFSERYDQSLLKVSSFFSHRASLIKQYFPEAIQVYRELCITSDIKLQVDPLQNTEMGIEDDQFKAWILQDWIDLRRLDKQQKKIQDELGRSQSQLEQTQEELEQTQKELEQTQTIIQSMASSKFWKIRQLWIGLKNSLGLNTN